MRRRTRLLLALTATGVLVVVLLATIIFVVVDRRRQQQELLDALNAQREGSDVQVVAATDVYADLESAAVVRLQQHTLDGSTRTIGAQIDARVLAQLEVFAPWPDARGTWSAARVEGSVYEVTYNFSLDGFELGPRWLVQMNPEGPSPEGSRGVVEQNALARFVELGDPTPELRYFNRSADVVGALTAHRFDNGARLASAILLYFRGRAEQTQSRVLGWTVVPEKIDPNGELEYLAVFRWFEGDTAEDALWQVSYQDGRPTFRPRDARADEIMNRGADVTGDAILDLMPRSLRDVQTEPSSEREPRVRALRYLLADDRAIEAVGALLALRAREGTLEYRQWHTDFEGESRDWCIVECQFDENGRPGAVTWRVNAATGDIEPVSDIARLAMAALRPMRPEAEGSGSDR
jgi:hypothetical protein